MSKTEVDDSSAPLVEHLIELRNRIVKALLAFVIAVVLAWFVWKPIFDFLTHPICAALIQNGQECRLSWSSCTRGSLPPSAFRC